MFALGLRSRSFGVVVMGMHDPMALSGVRGDIGGSTPALQIQGGSKPTGRPPNMVAKTPHELVQDVAHNRRMKHPRLTVPWPTAEYPIF